MNLEMKEKTYDVLKYIAQVVLPALGTLYFALAGIWSLSYGEQVVGTITAVDTFLGAILMLSSKNYTPTNITEDMKNEEDYKD